MAELNLKLAANQCMQLSFQGALQLGAYQSAAASKLWTWK